MSKAVFVLILCLPFMLAISNPLESRVQSLECKVQSLESQIQSLETECRGSSDQGDKNDLNIMNWVRQLFLAYGLATEDDFQPIK